MNAHAAQKLPLQVHLLVLVPLLIALAAGMIGIDFGYHWDEAIVINSVGIAVNSGSLLPCAYYYPSFMHELCFASLIPKLARVSYVKNVPLLPQMKIAMLFTLGNPSFKICTRILFMAISCLAILWVYICVWRWRRSWQEALVAASLMAFSWEVSYHSRFIASDALLMQFGALMLACLGNAAHRRWLYAAAASAGFACGTKYQGALLLLPVVCAAYDGSRKVSARNPDALLCLRLLSVFMLAYFITTPGTFLKPMLFLSDCKTQLTIYAHAHGGYTVKSIGEHLLLMCGYFCFAVFSKYPAVSSVFFLMALAGAAVMIRQEKGKALIFLSFPVVYIAFMSSMKIMQVRNLLILIPFLAIFAARGFGFLLSKLQTPVSRRIVAAVTAALLAVNACWILGAAFSVRNRNKTNYVARLAHYLDSHRSSRFLVSGVIAQALSVYDGNRRSNVSQDALPAAHLAVFYASEVSSWERWTANRFNYTRGWFGPYEVNFNYYPSWAGDDRIVVMPVRSALALGVFDALSQRR